MSVSLTKGTVMIVLVCGGKNLVDYWLVRRAFQLLVCRQAPFDTMRPVRRVVLGGPFGAAGMAKSMATTCKLEVSAYAADWCAHGDDAGRLRNQEMLDNEDVDVVLVFPGGRDTEDMCERAYRAGVPVVRVENSYPRVVFSPAKGPLLKSRGSPGKNLQGPWLKF